MRIDDEGGRNRQKNDRRPMTRSKPRERREETQNRQNTQGQRVNTWPHPDFTHATTRAEEETERGVALPPLTTRARETLRLCGQD